MSESWKGISARARYAPRATAARPPSLLSSSARPSSLVRRASGCSQPRSAPANLARSATRGRSPFRPASNALTSNPAPIIRPCLQQNRVILERAPEAPSSRRISSVRLSQSFAPTASRLSRRSNVTRLARAIKRSLPISNVPKPPPALAAKRYTRRSFVERKFARQGWLARRTRHAREQRFAPTGQLYSPDRNVLHSLPAGHASSSR